MSQLGLVVVKVCYCNISIDLVLEMVRYNMLQLKVCKLQAMAATGSFILDSCISVLRLQWTLCQ